MKKCINCGKFPFCNKIEDSQQEACEEFIKRSLESEVRKIDNKSNLWGMSFFGTQNKRG